MDFSIKGLLYLHIEYSGHCLVNTNVFARTSQKMA